VLAVIAIGASASRDEGAAPCQTCGACCSFSSEWPRFSLESEADLERIPPELVDDAHGRMRCDGNRCSALVGDIGVSTSCSIYSVRPEVCRACVPGDDACQLARRRFNLAPLPMTEQA
jgi:Fe-S-cluster containining protein